MRLSNWNPFVYPNVETRVAVLMMNIEYGYSRANNHLVHESNINRPKVSWKESKNSKGWILQGSLLGQLIVRDQDK